MTSDLTNPVSSTDGWTLTPAVASPFYNCPSLGTMLGGYLKFNQVSITKTYALPSNPYYGVQFRANVIKLDHWDYGVDFLTVELNGVQAYHVSEYYYGGVNRCGNPGGTDWNENIFDLYLNLITGATSLTVKVFDNFDETSDNESWGIMNVSVYLLLCDSECLGCYTYSNQCTGCVPGYYLATTTCTLCPTGCATCYSPGNCPTCTSSYYTSSPGVCSACDTSCQTCTAGGPNDCTSCNPGYVPQGSSCVLTCPDGKYRKLTPLSCELCVSPCALCEGPASNECLSCVSGFFLNPAPNPRLCASTCPSTYFGSSVSNKCQPCANNCKDCETPSGLCVSCLASFYFHAATKSCADSCPLNSFGNPTTFVCGSSCLPSEYLNQLRICSKCNFPCVECEVEGTGNECYKCSNPRFLYKKECLTSCPSGFYPDSASSTCLGNFFLYYN